LLEINTFHDMKRLSLLLFVLVSGVSMGQSIDYNKIIVTEQLSAISFEERLVQLSWRNHPLNKVATERVIMAQAQRAKARWSWLDNIYLEGNYNEFTGKDEVDDVARAFYPQYNVGVRLPLGTFAQTPLSAKVANEQMLIHEHEVNAQKLIVREKVLSSVERLKERYKIIKLRERVQEDYFLMFQSTEKKFRAGEVSLDVYRSASQAYYLKEEEIIQARSIFNQERIVLEGMIGVELKDVEGYVQFIDKLTTGMQGN
jgi:outer membrane protein TolC